MDTRPSRVCRELEYEFKKQFSSREIRDFTIECNVIEQRDDGDGDFSNFSNWKK